MSDEPPLLDYRTPDARSARRPLSARTFLAWCLIACISFLLALWLSRFLMHSQRVH